MSTPNLGSPIPGTPTRSLEGVRVLDLSRVLAGPFCAMILADLGAEVIKVESPGGDDSRFFGPTIGEDSGYYRLFNRSKVGITLDLKQVEQRDTLIELVRRSDVLIENFRPGVLERLGLSISSLRETNPKLVAVSISGFGQDGPLSQAPAYDLVAQAMSGLMSVTGWPGGQGTRIGISLGDLIPGLYGAIGALAALQERHLTGVGQHVDLSMLDSLISVLESVGMRALHEPEVPTAVGNDHALTVPFSTYAAADGPVVVAVSNDRLFEKLAAALDQPGWLTDPRFHDYDARFDHRDEMRAAIEAALAPFTADDAVRRLQEHGVPTARVANVREALTSEHARHRGVVAVESDGFQTLASPLRLLGSVPPSPAPRLGEHNHLVPGWLAEPAPAAASPEAAASAR
ncbi:CAIB/BAIF family protein [Leucobacter sp. 7(1)]|uniref:CaiB/BaiF CoA transferase family protein n=1 Tax=Leucobacter sp. 7(1) TaxID=1255613 RepID=UPI00097EED19|nr:CoA transferase [Leucobacter sp. 7(1)]SJN08077.1 CAIB/BAIF family protein [Leucobacter sp. 7(1)]